MTATVTPLTRELDHRVADGIDVRLLWRPVDDRVVVEVHDEHTGEIFVLEVAQGEHALDVFRHPFAYAATRLGATPWALAA
jgi:hypothetical protein